MTIINNSTSAFYQRSTQGLSGLRKQAEKLNEQMATKQKLSRSSDNPVAASKLRMLSRADSHAEIDKANATRAATDLQLADTALSAFTDYIIRIQTLTQSAGNDTMTDVQRAGIATELHQIHGNLVALANSRDSSGHALFGGETSATAYTVDGAGNATYVGTGNSGELPLGDGQSVQRGLTGPEFLNFDVAGTPTDLLDVVKDLARALEGAVPNPAQYARNTLGALTTALDTVTTGQTIIGARMTWVDLTTDRRIELSELRANEQIEIGVTDIPATVAKLSEVMLALDASQASFTKLASMSLFNNI